MKVKKVVFISIFLIFAILFLFSGTISAQDLSLDTINHSKSPMGALLRSAAVPGWGQLYNGKFVKAAVIGTGESLLIYQTVYYWKKMADYKDLYINADDETRAEKYALFDKYRDRRNQHIWFLGITIFYSMFDAYVDAHLSNFDFDLTPKFEEDTEEVSLWLTLSCSF